MRVPATSLQHAPHVERGNPTRCLVQTSDTSEQIYEQTEKIVADLKSKWDETEEKPAAIGLTVAAVVALYVMAGITSAIDKVPIVSGALELVGIFVTSWFVYRYLVFGPGALLSEPSVFLFLLPCLCPVLFCCTFVVRSPALLFLRFRVAGRFSAAPSSPPPLPADSCLGGLERVLPLSWHCLLASMLSLQSTRLPGAWSDTPQLASVSQTTLEQCLQFCPSAAPERIRLSGPLPCCQTAPVLRQLNKVAGASYNDVVL